MKKIIIIGAGSVGGHIAFNSETYGIKKMDIVGFLDDDPHKQNKQLFNYPVLGSIEWILDKDCYDVIIGIAFPKTKKKIVEIISINKSISFPTLIAKNAWISNNCEVNQGSIIYPGTAINYGSKIGEFVVANLNCSIGHDCIIGNYSSLAPGINLAGHTNVDELVEIGIGASTIQNIHIGEQTIVGGQTMIIKDVPPFSKIVGNPGRVIS